jgi:hypothetical protein
MLVIDDDDARHAVHPGSAKSAGFKSAIDEHRRLFARIAKPDGVAARGWTTAADDALRLNASSVPVERHDHLGWNWLVVARVDAAMPGDELLRFQLQQWSTGLRSWSPLRITDIAACSRHFCFAADKGHSGVATG